MSVLLIVFAGLLGLAVGSFVNVVVYRLPAHISLLEPSQCPSCGVPVRVWQNIPVLSWLLLRGRCRACRSAIDAKYPIVEGVTGIAFAALAWFVPEVLGLRGVAGVLVWTAFSWFAAASLALALIDVDTFTLPNRIVLPTSAVGLVLLSAACLAGAPWPDLGRALIGAAGMGVSYWLIRVLRPDGMGGGDVKLAGMAGLFLGWLGWGPLAVGWLAAFLLGGLWGVALIAAGKANRRTAVPFGPWILAGAWVGVWVGQWTGQAYVSLFGLS
jgi:leader peptidase (prepilin peptidase)/N-methyltransferase